jgi:5-(carboxyamino)imidazole ribonucleotide synthase
MTRQPRVGILGGGQLGRMLAMAGLRLGVRCRVFDQDPHAVAADAADLHTDRFDQPSALEPFLRGLEVVTYEFENVPATLGQRVAERLPLRPGVVALAATQDRLAEKNLFAGLGIPTPVFRGVDSPDQLRSALAQDPHPRVLKTRRLGYDGKGQGLILPRPGQDLYAVAEETWRLVSAADTARSGFILEHLVPFTRELSIIGVRGVHGQTAFYPLVENHHARGILRLSLAPAPSLTPRLQAHAEDLATRVMEHLGYVGVMTLELFDLGPDQPLERRLLANEVAPRVHNSGHWSIDAGPCSQFENHLRAILGLPLGGTDPGACAVMINLIGTAPPLHTLASIPGARVHLYAKAPRPGRKLGHVTLVEPDLARLAEVYRAARAALTPDQVLPDGPIPI